MQCGELVSRHRNAIDWDSKASVAGSVGVATDQRDQGIPTKPAGGLQSDIGKVAPIHGQIGAPYWTALKWLNVPPWAPALHPWQAPAGVTIYAVQ